jgi:hypothetical protein
MVLTTGEYAGELAAQPNKPQKRPRGITCACGRRFSRRVPGGVASKAILVCDGEPALGGFAEIGANLVECLALGVAARQRGDRGRIAASVGLRADDRREIDGDIDDNGRSGGRCIAHGQDPPVLVVYPP